MTALRVLVKQCARPFLFFWKKITEACKKIWGFCDWLTKHKPLINALWFFWILFVAYASYPLLGNSFALNGWKNAFDEPWGFVIFGTTVIVGVVLIVSQIRSRSRSSIVSLEWNRRYLQATRAIIVIVPIAYFLFYALQAQFSNDSGATPSSIKETTHQYNQLLQPATTPTIVEATLTGTEEFGVKLLSLDSGQKAKISWIEGNICVKGSRAGQKTLCLDLHSFPDSDQANYGKERMWSKNYRYREPGIKAGETLVILGAIESAEETVYEFIEGKNTITIHNISEKTLPLTLYVNLVKNYWISNDGHLFPTSDIAASFGNPNAKYEKGFQQKYYVGSAKFLAQILN